MSDQELLNKLQGMDALTKSQVDRMNKSIEIQDNLFSFLGSQIDKVKSESSMKAQLLESINDRIEDEGFENIQWAVILKLLEIYSKEENTIAITLLNMIKDVQLKNSENDSIDKLAEAMKKGGGGEGDMSKEELQEFKGLYDFFKKVKDSELPDKK